MKKILQLLILMSIFSANAQMPLDGLMHYYSFNKGNVDDEMGGNDGVNTSVVYANDRFGRANSALYLDGNSNPQNVKFGDINIINPNFTLSFWINYNSMASTVQEKLLTKRSACTVGKFFDIAVTSTGVGLELYDGNTNAGSSAASAATTTNGKWYHIAFVVDQVAKTTKKYYNGVLVSTKSWGTNLSDINNSADFGISVSPCIGNTSVAGYIGYFDDLAVYDKPLNDNEIYSLYAQPNSNSAFTFLSDSYNSTSCVGYSETITVNSTDSGINYYWIDKVNNSIVSGPVIGTGSSISYNTPMLNSSIKYAVQASNNLSSVFEENKSLRFDGTSSYISVPDNNDLDLLSGWTLEAWIQPNNTSIQQALIEKYEWITGKGGYAMRIANGKLSAYAIEGQTFSIVSGTTNIENGKWVHVSATFDNANNELRVYLNGVLEATNSSATTNPSVGSGVLKFGCNGDNLSHFFNGNMSEVRIWNYARTSSDISSNLFTKFNGNETGLVALYEFDQPSLTSLNDKTSNSYDGSLVGFTSTDVWYNGHSNYSQQVTKDILIDVKPCIDTLQVTFSDTVCSGNSTNVDVLNSQNNLNYFLVDKNTMSVVDGPTQGNGNTLTFNSGNLTSNSNYAVRASLQSFIGQPYAENNAVEFDGSNDVINTTYAFGNYSQFSIEVMINPIKTTYTRYVSSFDGSGAVGNGEIILDNASSINNGKGLRLYVGGTPNLVVSYPNVLELGVWNHVVAVFDSGEVKMYVNKKLIGTYVGSVTTIVPQPSRLVSIGEDYGIGTANEFFAGRMDYVRIWSKALTENEIFANEYAILNGSEQSLELLYQFDESNTSTTVYDLTTNGNDGTLLNFSTINRQKGMFLYSDYVEEFVSITVQSCLGVNDENTLNALKLQPNPAQKYVQIVTDEFIHNIVVADIKGNEIKLPINHKIIDVQSLAKGMYLVKITTHTSQYFHKLMINR